MGKKVTIMRKLVGRYNNAKIFTNICDGKGCLDPTGGWRPHLKCKDWNELSAQRKKERLEQWFKEGCADPNTLHETVDVLAGVPPAAGVTAKCIATDSNGKKFLYKNITRNCDDPTGDWMPLGGRKKWVELDLKQRRRRIKSWVALGRPPAANATASAGAADEMKGETALSDGGMPGGVPLEGEDDENQLSVSGESDVDSRVCNEDREGDDIASSPESTAKRDALQAHGSDEDESNQLPTTSTGDDNSGVSEMTAPHTPARDRRRPSARLSDVEDATADLQATVKTQSALQARSDKRQIDQLVEIEGIKSNVAKSVHKMELQMKTNDHEMSTLNTWMRNLQNQFDAFRAKLNENNENRTLKNFQR